MRVHLIRKETIENYIRLNARSSTSLEDWLAKLSNADWEQPGDIKKTYGSADLLGKGSNKVIFDLGGNNYRMICIWQKAGTSVYLLDRYT